MKTAFRLLKYAKKYWGYLILSMAALMVLTASQLGSPWVTRNMVALITNNDPELGKKSIYMAVLLIVLYLIQALSQFIRTYYTHYAAWNFVSDMRVKMYDHLQKLSLRFYHDKQTGQLMSRVSNDTAALETLIAHAVPDLIINVLMLIGVAVILFSMNPALAFLSMVTFPFLIVSVVYFAKKVLPKFKEAQQCLAEFNAVLHDNLTGIKEIQAFNQQEREYSAINKSSLKYAK